MLNPGLCFRKCPSEVSAPDLTAIRTRNPYPFLEERPGKLKRRETVRQGVANELTHQLQ
jgi:hypothetical protein